MRKRVRTSEVGSTRRERGRKRIFACRAAGTLLTALLALLLPLTSLAAAPAQGGGHTLFGDVKVDEGRSEGLKPLNFDIILYSRGGDVLGRQTVTNNGRYRFLNVANGEYDLAVEVEGTEVARVRVMMQYPFKTDHRQDLFLEWKASAQRSKPQTVSAADFYRRTRANQSLFGKAQKAVDARKHEEAEALLRRLLAADPQDFQAWTELGTVHLLQGRLGEAEGDYRRALEERPAFALALLNLGRVLMAQRKFDAAVEPLKRAVAAQPTSAGANLLLGEAYLQLKEGSKAVTYLKEAIRLGKTEGHLRLAALYHAAGLRERAAAEYEQFLAKNPNHPDREKFEQYIKENKSRQ